MAPSVQRPVKPGVVVWGEGNSRQAKALLDQGCQVHTFRAAEVGLNGR